MHALFQKMFALNSMPTYTKIFAISLSLVGPCLQTSCWVQCGGSLWSDFSNRMNEQCSSVHTVNGGGDFFTGRMPQSCVSRYLNLLKVKISTCCTDSRETWHSRGALGSAWPCKISCQLVPGGVNVAPKWQKFPLFGKESPHMGEPFDRFQQLLGAFMCPTTLH